MKPSSNPPLVFSQRTFIMGLIGIGMLYATPFLSSYSYTVTSTSPDAKIITISYVYPLLLLLPILLTCGVALTVYGLWNSRRLLIAHRNIPATLGWLAIASVLPLSNWLTDITLSVLHFSPVWATGTEFTMTPTYGIVLLQTGSTIAVLSLLGVWMTRRLLRMREKTVTIAFGLGALLTFLSLLSSAHVIGVSFEEYQRGFPLPWLVFPDGFTAARGWFPTGFFVYDLLLWSALVYAGILVVMKERQIFLHLAGTRPGSSP